MFDFLSANLTVVALIEIFGVFLGVWIYLSNPNSKANKYCSLMTLSVLAWIVFGYLSHTDWHNLQINLNLYRINLAIVSSMFIFSYFFSVYFPVEGKRHYNFDKFLIAFNVFLILIILFTDKVVLDSKSVEWGINFVLGKYNFLFYGMVYLMTPSIVFTITAKYFTLDANDKVKVQYFLVGLTLLAIFNLIYNVSFPVIWGSFRYYWAGDYSMALFVGFSAYAIITKQLFGIRVALTVLFAVLIAIWPIADFLMSFQGGVSLDTLIFKGAFLLVFLIFDAFLVRGVLNEIKQKEQLSALNSQLDKVNFDLKDLNLHLQEKVDEQTKEIKQAYEIEKKAKTELETLDKAKSEFILTTQHHLRTPLTIVKGYIEAALTGSLGPLTDKLKDSLGKSNAAADRLMSLVNEFLDISQMEVGKSILKLELSNIKPLIKDVIEELKPDMEKSHITISYPQDEESYPSILMDSKKMKEALIIFIDNAVKYNKENGSINIVTKTFFHPIEKDKKLYQIIMENTGIGIKSDELPKLFTHFFERSDEARKVYATGRGLGLNIAKSIINAHQGTVRVESEGEGKGAKFIIELPM
jgi:signal transduction histidine kinase